MTIRHSVMLIVLQCLLAACNTRMSGQIVDADTRQPIEGAVVLIHRGVGCFNPLRSFEMINPLEVLTDRQGRFVADLSTDAKYQCLSKGVFVGDVMIMAPGYLMEYFIGPGWKSDERPIEQFGAGPVSLTHIKYQVEYERYARRPKDRESDWVNQDAAPRWRNALEILRSASVHKLGEPAVFVNQAGSAFDQIGLIDLRFQYATWKSSAILARDKNTGIMHGWNFRGTSVPLPIPRETDLSVVGYHSRMRYPFLSHKDRLYFPASFDSSPSLDRFDSDKWSSIQSQSGNIHFAASYSVSGFTQTGMGISIASVATVEGPNRELGVYKLDESVTGKGIMNSVSRDSYRLLFPKRRLSIECMASGPEEDSLVVIAKTTDGRVGFYLPAWGDLGKGEPDAKRFDHIPEGVLTAEITACAVGWDRHLYVSIRNQGIRKFEIPAAYPGIDKRPRTEAPFWQSSRASILETAIGPKNFTSLIVSEREKGWYAVYGVADDQNIYRFTADGVPEQRIEIDLSASMRPQVR